VRGDDEETVGLAERRGHLRDVLGRGDPDAAGQTRLVHHAPAEHDGDPARAPPQPARPAHVEERLVDRERLDEGRDVVEDAHDAL
jgi:hypothetical protein